MFIGKLVFEKVLDHKESFVGRPLYRLSEPFSYQNDKVKLGYVVTCETGYMTDFASIPEWIFFINPKATLWRKAAAIHDKACNEATVGELTYREADSYLYYGMRECDAPLITTWLFWSVCRVNHMIKQLMRL